MATWFMSLFIFIYTHKWISLKCTKSFEYRNINNLLTSIFTWNISSTRNSFSKTHPSPSIINSLSNYTTCISKNTQQTSINFNIKAHIFLWIQVTEHYNLPDQFKRKKNLVEKGRCFFPHSTTINICKIMSIMKAYY